MIKTILFISIILVNIDTGLHGQEMESPNWEQYFTANPRKHSLSFQTGFVMIPNSFETDVEVNSRLFFVGMFGVDYTYSFTPKTGIGISYEVETGQYFVDDGGTAIPRENVQVMAAVFAFELFKGLEAFAGPGYEYEVQKSFFILKAGITYRFLIANDWYFEPELSYNYKEVYDNFSLAIHFRKKFGRIMKE